MNKSHPGLVPFQKGDKRINRHGRPRSFDTFRALAQKIAAEKIPCANGKLITVADAILRSWAKSKEPALQQAFIAYAFGKPENKIDMTGLENRTTLVLHYAHERERVEREQQEIRVLPSNESNGAK